MERAVKAARLETLSMSNPKEVEAEAKKFAEWFNSGKGFKLRHIGDEDLSAQRHVMEKTKKRTLLAQFYTLPLTLF